MFSLVEFEEDSGSGDDSSVVRAGSGDLVERGAVSVGELDWVFLASDCACFHAFRLTHDLHCGHVLVIAQLQRPPMANEVEESLKQLLNRWEKLQTLNDRERKMLVRNAAKTMDAARERAKAEPHLILPDEDVGLGFNDVVLESAISGVSSEEVQILGDAFESFDAYDRESDSD